MRAMDILHVVIHREFERMWPQAQHLNLAFTLVLNPSIDHALTKNVALQQELMIVFQFFQRFIERTRQTLEPSSSCACIILSILD